VVGNPGLLVFLRIDLPIPIPSDPFPLTAISRFFVREASGSISSIPHRLPPIPGSCPGRDRRDGVVGVMGVLGGLIGRELSRR
jgi:hypothetical protein